MSDKCFKENLRVDRRTFNYILGIVGPMMERGKIPMIGTVDVGKRLAIALTVNKTPTLLCPAKIILILKIFQVLATNCEYNEIGHMYGQGKTTIHDCFKSFIKVAKVHLVNKHIKMPSLIEFERISEEFEQRWQYPMAIGCIDGSHFPVQVPKSQALDYYNYKGWLSVLVLAICDANYKVILLFN